jgi:2-keto-4-pentenoate hydratase
MTPRPRRDEARRLDEAARSRQQIRMISLRHSDMTMADAYVGKRAWREIDVGAGRKARPGDGEPLDHRSPEETVHARP